MKKSFLWFAIGLFAAFSMNVFAQTYVYFFTDDKDFSDWYSESVYKMKDQGVITGYPDGSFGPSKNVSRAELAVMLDRYDDVVQGQVKNLMYALNDLGYLAINDDDKPYAMEYLLAESGFFMLDEVPNGYGEDEFVKEPTPEWLPDGYTVYSEIYTVYLRYKGERYVGQDSMVVDQWYGPFSVYDSAGRYNDFY